MRKCLRAIALTGGPGCGSRHSSGASEPGGPVPRTGFDPRAHGFHFANEFVDKVVTVPGYGEVATAGRSGGMAFAALDYWFAGLPVPSHRPDDFPDRAVPSDGTRLADFIHKRLFDSYATWSARHFLTWTLAEDHPTWSSPGVARLTARSCPGCGAASTPVARWCWAWLGRGPWTAGPGPGGPQPPGRRLRLGLLARHPPGEPGAVDEVGVTVIPPPRRARVSVTFAAVTVEDAEALGGRLALRLAVGDQAARWPVEGRSTSRTASASSSTSGSTWSSTPA